MRLLLLIVQWVCCIWLCLSVAQAQTPVQPVAVDSAFTSQNIGFALELLEDPGAQLTLADIRIPTVAQQFKPSVKKSPSFGFTSSAYWARFRINVQSDTRYSLDAPLYLNLAYGQTDLINVWCFDAADKLLMHQRAGDHVPLEEWPITHREPAFQIPPVAHTCYMRIKTSSTLQFPLTLSTQQAFEAMHLNDAAIQALYFGALLVMFFYNFLVAFTTRSWAYVSYTAFLLSYGLFQCAFGGLGYALLWPNAIGWADRAMLLSLVCIGLTSCFFVITLLDLRNATPRFYKMGKTLLIFYALYAAGFWFLPYSTAIKIIVVTIPFWALFLIGTGIYLSWRKVREAQIYLVAWLMFVLGPLIIVGSTQGWIPINAFTANASQIGSVVEFILLSFALTNRIKNLQLTLLQAQEKVTHHLRTVEQQLEHQVAERTAQLELANQEMLGAYTLVDAARQKAEDFQVEAEQAQRRAEAAQLQATQALQNLQVSQKQLVQAEKMAALGLLVSNVAHEINSPLGAINSSNTNIADSMRATMQNMSRLLETISREHRTLFLQLVSHTQLSDVMFSSREERSLTKQLTTFLENAGVDGAVRKARLLVRLRAHSQVSEYLPLLTSPDCDFILSVAAGVADVLSGTSNIHTATLKISRILASLKELSGGERTLSLFENFVHQSVEKAIADLSSQLHDVDVVRIYQDIGPLRCDQKALQQVWSHLILNGLHAMQHRGVIMIGIRAVDNQAEIRFSDFGCGIASEIKDRIFEPFFTTRSSGEGGGMGLAIVKNIVEQHHGRIDVKTEVGFGTTVTVFLPYQPAA